MLRSVLCGTRFDKNYSRMPENPYRTITPLNSDWQVAWSPDKVSPDQLDRLNFQSLESPFSATAVANHFQGRSVDDLHIWFRYSFLSTAPKADERISVEFEGLATLVVVWLNGHRVLESDSMFMSHLVDVSSTIATQNELLLECLPLTSALRSRRRSTPALRWKTRVVTEQQLRFFRTTLFGRAPGFAPGPPMVGPWRPVTLVRESRLMIEHWQRKAEVIAKAGVVQISCQLRMLDASIQLTGGTLRVGETIGPLLIESLGSSAFLKGMVHVPDPELWWPHTHGNPKLYPLSVDLNLSDRSRVVVNDVPCGFRTVTVPNPESAFGLQLNEQDVFCRGVVWTGSRNGRMRDQLELLRAAGFNLIRIPGTAFYEEQNFHNLCDELGLMVWQDMMFANMDYPFGDPAFLAAVTFEAETELQRIAIHPSTALVCGNSEVEQQASMLGHPSSLSRAPFFGQVLPEILAHYCPRVPYVPSAPFGGDLPFRTNCGVANYFGVGAYLRPLGDARAAEVRFASECLAFANVPEPEMFDCMVAKMPGGLSPIHPAWKAGVPRDCGAGWDFEDVRDFYLELLYKVRPSELRYSDTDHYWRLSRMVSGEVMSEVFSEWRRSASPCQGAIILSSTDLVQGAGWGILDSAGNPKAPYFYLKRVLQPCTLFFTDEGLNGVDLHITNDGPNSRTVRLRVALYKSPDQLVAQVAVNLSLPPRHSVTHSVEELIGHFVDASYAYRFGPPGHDVIVAELCEAQNERMLAHAFYYPLGRNSGRSPIADFSFNCASQPVGESNYLVTLRSCRLVYGLHIAAPGFQPDDNYFSLEPGVERNVVLSSTGSVGRGVATATITAANALGQATVKLGVRV